MSLKVAWEHRLGNGEAVEYGKGTLKQAMQSHIAWVGQCEQAHWKGYDATTDIAVGRGMRPKLRWTVYGNAYGSVECYCYCYYEHRNIGLVDYVKLESHYWIERLASRRNK